MSDIVNTQAEKVLRIRVYPLSSFAITLSHTKFLENETVVFQFSKAKSDKMAGC